MALNFFSNLHKNYKKERKYVSILGSFTILFSVSSILKYLKYNYIYSIMLFPIFFILLNIITNYCLVSKNRTGRFFSYALLSFIIFIVI